MDVIYGLIPMVLIAGLLVVVAFIWMAKNGHFDDMDGQANRILMDDFDEDDKAEDTDGKETKSEDGIAKAEDNNGSEQPKS